jgi:drug/metabolite transporter (DMT)-like permease
LGPLILASRPIGARTGYLLVVVGAFCFAAGGNAVKVLLKFGYSAEMLAQLRIWWAFFWLLLALLLLSPRRLRVQRRQLPALAVFGGLGLAGVQFFYYLTISRLNIAIALLVQYLGLVLITGWERFRRQQQVGQQIWLALALVLIGAFFAVGAYQPSLFRLNLPGVGLGLVSAVFFAFYMLRASTLAHRLNTWTILLYGFASGAVVWALYDLATRAPFPTDWRVWALMALVGLIGTVVGHALFVRAVAIIRPSTAGIISTAEPVFAGIIAFFLLGDRLQPLQIGGGAVVLLGISMVQLGIREEPVAAAVLQ